jgi:hypothetical protein
VQDSMRSKESHSLIPEILSKTWREGMNSMWWNSAREKDRLMACSVSILTTRGRVNSELTLDIFRLLIGLSSHMRLTWLLITSGKIFMLTQLELIFIISIMKANFKLIKKLRLHLSCKRKALSGSLSSTRERANVFKLCKSQSHSA